MSYFLKPWEDVVRGRKLAAMLTLGLAVNLTSWMILPVTAQPTVQRKVLLTQDLPIPGYQAVMAAVEIPVGGREGRHTHPGAVFVFVQERINLRGSRRQSKHRLQGRGLDLYRGG
jgi:hypothetical protein